MLDQLNGVLGCMDRSSHSVFVLIQDKIRVRGHGHIKNLSTWYPLKKYIILEISDIKEDKR